MRTIAINHNGKLPPVGLYHISNSPYAAYLQASGNWVVYRSGGALVGRMGEANGWGFNGIIDLSHGNRAEMFVPNSATVGATYIVEWNTYGDTTIGRFSFEVGEQCSFFDGIAFLSNTQNSFPTPAPEQIDALSGNVLLRAWPDAFDRIEDNTLASINVNFAVDWGDGTPVQLFNDTYNSGALNFTDLTHHYTTPSFDQYIVNVSWQTADVNCQATGDFPPYTVQVKQKRYLCSNYNCAEFYFDYERGFKTEEECIASGCETLPTRYICAEYGCLPIQTTDESIGYETEQECLKACHGCDFEVSPLALDKSTPDLIKASVLLILGQNWDLHVVHRLNGFLKPNPAIAVQIAPLVYSWQVPQEDGKHTFSLEWTKEDCPLHLTEGEITISPTGCPPDFYWNGVQCVPETDGHPCAPGYHWSEQHQMCLEGEEGECPPCPPPPDPVTCANTISIEAPTANASLKNFALIRAKVTDPNEQTDPCHHNYNRPCNHESDGPALQLFLGDYLVPVQWKFVPQSGTPLNGTWEALLDTRDYSNGDRPLRVSMRGVGCCRKESTVNVSLANTLQGNIFYRDTHAQAPEGFIVPDAMLGVETHALALNTSRRYWEQWAVRSGTTLDGAYKHDDWPKHQPVLPILGAQWYSQGERIERHNYSAHVTFRLPLARQIRFRRKWTPQFFLSAFDLNAESVTKIRQVTPGTHFVWTQNPPRAHLYDGEKLTLLGDFNQTTMPDGTAAINTFAPDAVDAAFWESEDGGRKIIVIAAESEENPNGEMFAFDPDSDDVAMNYSVRNHPLVPRFVEVVKNIPIALYTGDTLTHAYDLRFGAPRLKWTHPDRVTFCTLDGNTLLIAFGPKLYSTDGLTTPTLVREFTSPVTAATKTFVGLQNGQLWKKNKTTNVWAQVHSHTGTITGLTAWSAGTALQGVPGLSEAQTNEERGVVGGEGDWLLGERPDDTWFDERQLIVPTDLASKSVQRVSALDHFSVTVAAPSTSDDATQLPSKDERLLIGTAQSGLLFVYQRSLLSEKDGAIPVSHDTIPRLFPFHQKP